MLQTASMYGLLINWNKYHFLQTRIEYLRHIIENGSIRPSEHKTGTKPKTVKSVQGFLGLAGYFRKFANQYSIIVRPLTRLLKSDVEFKFGIEEEQAFENLKTISCSGPVLKLLG